ncbi:hypothetical protein E2C01_098626 [Portunus trituberculatus]|uniref:Uncharacterized protein n=1 Tax=Portunus trituberculatus TaxID=210409 RepID=A0A5B7JYA5_PORTR|nr:hypothetical protein [Portunus trituberculatus]
MEVKSFYGPFTFTLADVNTSRHLRNPDDPFPLPPLPGSRVPSPRHAREG